MAFIGTRPEEACEPPNKGMKLTKPGQLRASQLNSSVLRTVASATGASADTSVAYHFRADLMTSDCGAFALEVPQLRRDDHWA